MKMVSCMIHIEQIILNSTLNRLMKRLMMVQIIMWGVIDIVSAGSCEMEKHYGVVYVDANNLGQGTYKRYKKYSFIWYHDFIENKHKQFN